MWLSDIDRAKFEKWFTIFLILLFTEGIFRKWVVSGSVSSIFMILRDPIVLLIVIKGHKMGLFNNKYARMIVVISCFTFAMTMLLGHQNILVCLFAARITMIYIPAIYICGNVLTMSYIENVGRFFLFLFVPVVILTVLQFVSPTNSWVNHGLGLEERYSGVAGDIMLRPSGIFMHISGLTDYYLLVFSFLFMFFVEKKLNSVYIRCLFILYVISIPVSISRTHFFMTFIALIFYTICMTQRKFANDLIKYVCLIVSFALILSQFPFMSRFIDTFMARLVNANASEGGAINSMFNRTFGYVLNLLEKDVPLFGYGDGFFTNFGVQMIYGSVGVANISDSKLVAVLEAAEMEWARLMMEDGIIVGGVLVLLRILMAIQFFRMTKESLKNGNSVPLYFAPPAIIYMSNSQLKVPTHLGFLLVACALFMASYNKNMYSWQKNAKKFC